MRFLFLPLFLSVLLNVTFAAEPEQPTSIIYRNSSYFIDYKANYGEGLNDIFELFCKSGSRISPRSDMVKKIKKNNPHVKDWKHLAKGERVKIYIDGDIFDLEKYTRWKLGESIPKFAIIKPTKPTSVEHDGFPGLKASLFYMASQGSFNQKSEDLSLDINFSQNSPVTLGLAMLYYPLKKNYSFSSSIYYSHLTAGDSNLAQTVDIPPEVGFNFYVQHAAGTWTPYWGIDYEKFSTFNTQLLATTSELTVDSNTVLYGTVGIAKFVPKIFKRGLFFKASLSKSIFTDTAPGGGGATPTKEYDGYKYMLYVNHKIDQDWFVHILAKYHTMTGPDDLSVTRYGIGLGYILK